MTRKPAYYFAVLAGALILLWGLGFAGFVRHAHSLEPASAAEKKADGIVVLTGGPNRINAGLDLLSNKKAEALFISGVDKRVTTEKLLSMWKSNTTATPCCIVLGRKARNTRENARETQQWIGKNNIRSILLVTSLFHMPRAYLEFKTLMPDLAIHMTPVTPSKRTLRDWRLAFVEYNKTLLTFSRIKFKTLFS